MAGPHTVPSSDDLVLVAPERVHLPKITIGSNKVPLGCFITWFWFGDEIKASGLATLGVDELELGAIDFHHFWSVFGGEFVIHKFSRHSSLELVRSLTKLVDLVKVAECDDLLLCEWFNPEIEFFAVVHLVGHSVVLMFDFFDGWSL